MKIDFAFRPKLAETLKDYSARSFLADLNAGLIVGIVALPLSLALAIASGLPPAIGLFTAVIGGLLVSLFGGSRVQIGGPAGAFVPLLAPIVMTHGPEALVVCAFMAGAILFVLGATRLGVMIKYIPFPVVTGFTSGIAIIIMSTQIKDFFGLTETLPSEFLGKLKTFLYDKTADGQVVFLPHFQLNPATVLLATVSTLAIWYWPKKLGKFLPASMAVVAVTTLGEVFLHLNDKFSIATLGSRFGDLSRTLPVPHWPALSLEAWHALVPAAMTIAVLGAIESLLSAVVADGMMDDRHDSNQELMGQGIANMAMGIFGGMPCTGVIARTATNVRSGGRTPVAGIVHALTVLVILLAAAPLAKNIPLAALAAVLVVVSLRMGEWHQFVRLNRWPKSDVLVFLCAFCLTVVLDLPTAVGASLILASALMVKRLAQTASVEPDAEVTQGSAAGQQTAGKNVPDGVVVFRVFGAFFFGAADKLETSLRDAGRLPEVLILRMRDVLALDATGLEALEDLREKLRRDRKNLILCGPHSQSLFALTRAGFMEKIGEENVCGDMESSLARARQLLEQKKNKKNIDSIM
jgi:sulfate permease, SulP family